MTQITIRGVHPEDVDKVAQVEAVCFSAAEAASRDSLARRIAAHPECLYAAEADGEMIGIVTGCVTNSPVIFDEMFHDTAHHIPAGENLAIFGLAVIPEYRGQGVAARLMNHYIALAKATSRKSLILTCKEKLIHYYESFGFVNSGVSQSAHGGAQWYDMTLKL